MAVICVSEVQITGDIGGVGISRFHWQNATAGNPSSSDCNSAAAAIYDLFHTAAVDMPSDITVTNQPEVQYLDMDTAQLLGSQIATTTGSPAVGTSSGQYAAGVGARINWQTSTVHGRRFIRGTTYVVPLGPGAYTTSGGLSTACQANLSTAAANYLNAMLTAGLVPGIYGRPKHLALTGGHFGPITTWLVPSTPAGLRSRRS